MMTQYANHVAHTRSDIAIFVLTHPLTLTNQPCCPTTERETIQITATSLHPIYVCQPRYFVPGCEVL